MRNVDSFDILLFSSDFPPLDGGVANYAFEIARELMQKGRLKNIITYVEEAQERNPMAVYSVVASMNRNLGSRFGDGVPFIRRLNTAWHYYQIKCAARKEWKRLVGSTKSSVVAVSCYGYKQALHLKVLSELNISYTLVLHGLDIVTNMKQIEGLFKEVCSKAQKIIVNSSATKKLLLSSQPHLSSRCSVQHPILDLIRINSIPLLDRLQLSKRFGMDLVNRVLFFSAARLIKRKGIDIAIRTMVKLHDQFSNVCFLIAGKGSEYASLLSLIEQQNATSYIKLIGYISEEEKFSILRESSFFLMPTHSLGNSDFEGFGISFIEASYFENVVFGGVHGGVPEAIQNERSGYTLDFDVIEGEELMLKYIIELLVDNDKQKAMATFGRKYVMEHFVKMDDQIFNCH